MNEEIIYKTIVEKPCTKRELIGNDYDNFSERNKLDRILKRLLKSCKIGCANLHSTNKFFFSYNKQYNLVKTKNKKLYYFNDVDDKGFGRLVLLDCYNFENRHWEKVDDKIIYANNIEVML